MYARVSTRLMNRWMFGTHQSAPVVSRQLKESDERFVTFLDFVQAMAIRAIRLNFKIPLPKIRAAVEKANSEFGVQYPFAMKHKTFLFSDKARQGHGELIIRMGDDRYFQLSGPEAGNRLITEVVEMYMDDLAYGDDGLAATYRAYERQGGVITMNPHIRLGEPIVANCGYSARTLWEASVNEGGIQQAANAYGVTPEDVKLACAYFDHLNNPTVEAA